MPDVAAGRRDAALRLAEPFGGRRGSGSEDAATWTSLLGGPLGASELEVLAGLSETRHVGQGQGVLSRCAAASALVAVRSGEVALGLRTSDGNFRTERIVHGPAWLDLSSAWVGEAHAMDAQAQTPVVVLELPRQALAERLAEHPGLAQRLIEVIHQWHTGRPLVADQREPAGDQLRVKGIRSRKVEDLGHLGGSQLFQLRFRRRHGLIRIIRQDPLQDHAFVGETWRDVSILDG